MFLLFFSCKNKNLKKETGANSAELISLYYSWQETLETSIINDFFSPVVASRVYVYPNIALNGLLNYKQQKYNLLIDGLPKPDSTIQCSIASLFSFYYTAKGLVFNSSFLDTTYTNYKQSLLNLGYTEDIINEADSSGKTYAAIILNWASKDMYKQMRSFVKYKPKQTPGTWMPTPPDYFDALEPHWEKLRTLLLDSASQFRATPPPAFSTNKESIFYKNTLQVFNISKEIDKGEKKIIGAYWDCNPMVLKHEGHATYSDKKLTPGGHWLNIGLQYAKSKNLSFEQVAYANAVLSVAIFDGFISCWDTKYYYNYVRPVTAINNLIDANWLPLLTTPNFPEYTSGHSVISSCCAKVLTTFYGDNASFIDSSEVKFGNAARKYTSFKAASEEAAISRLYGGIHFYPAIENGKIQGDLVGDFIIKKMKLVPLTKN